MKKWVYALLAISIFYILLLFLPVVEQQERAVLYHPSFRIAHRCGKLLYPENTLYACKEIIKNNLADFLEFDFHLTKDGVPVVIHDSTLDRTTNGTGPIEEKNWDEIKTLDAAYYFSLDGGKTYPLRGKGITLSTLEEFIRELKNFKLMIEVKTNSKEAADILLELVERYKMEDKVVLASFHQGIKDYMQQKKPNLAYIASKKDVTLWVILEKLNLSHLWNLRSQAMALPPQQSILRLNEELIQKAHNQKVSIHVWTINDRDEMIYWIQKGVDGIITDDPKLLTEVIHSLNKDENQ